LNVDKLANLTWGGFLILNLVPVTLGNILGGAGMVGLIYWFVYLRKEPATALPQAIWDRCTNWVHGKTRALDQG
jgi:hypothetical protein